MAYFYRGIKWMIKSIAADFLDRIKKLCCCAFSPQTLTDSERVFVKVNSNFWAQYAYLPVKGRSCKYVLVPEESHIILAIQNATLAEIVASVKRLRILFVLSTSNTSRKKVLSSFPNSTFMYLDSWRYFLSWVFSFFQALKAYKSLVSTDDILAFKVDAIKFGDLIYDSILAEGFATLDIVDERTLRHLRLFYFYRSIIKDIIKRFNIESAVISHQIGVRGGTSCRYLIHNNIELIRRAGSGVLLFRKIHKSNEVFHEIFTPERKYFEYMLDNCNDFIVSAERYLKTRLNGQAKDFGDLDGNPAYKKERRIFTSREEFCRHCNLNPTKKNIFVMLHAFNDFPHCYDWQIYRDYYQWFKATLEVALETDSVNWIFKEDPCAAYYPTKDLDLDALFKDIQTSNIRFLNRDADFNTNSLLNIGDALITCTGTAALEYSAMGIPCVLGGSSAYSGFGFTIEPRTDAEYRNILKNISALVRLDKQQIVRAKLIMYYELKMAFDAPDPFSPYYGFEQQKSLSVENFFKDLLSHRFKTGVIRQKQAVSFISEFILDPGYNQYINSEKYGALRASVKSSMSKENRIYAKEVSHINPVCQR